MFDIFRENPRKTWLMALVLIAVSLIYMGYVLDLSLAENDGKIGALLDDTWIHVRFADHIAAGEGLTYNHNEITFGATSPLWVYTLGFVFSIVKPSIWGEVDIAIILSLISYIIAVLSIAGFGWWTSRQWWVGLGAGLITALTGRFLWMGFTGMEITTFTWLCIMALWSHSYDMRENRTFGWRTGILTALATLARPEAYLLAVVIGFDAFVLQALRLYWRDRQFDWTLIRKHWFGNLRGSLAYMSIAGLYPLYSLIESGHPLPNTFRAKSRLGTEFPTLEQFTWVPRNEHTIILFGLAILGWLYLLWQARRRADYQFVWAIWYPLFVLGVLLQRADNFIINNSRYLSPVTPFHALLAMFGLWFVLESAQKYLKFEPKLWVNVLLVIVLAGLVLERGYDNATGVPRGTRHIYEMHIAAGEWIRDTTNPDDIVALNDVGAIVHVSDRRVLDLEGLVSPEVIEATAGTDDYTCPHDLALTRLMLEQRPVYLGIFPWFYPCLARWDSALQALVDFKITGPTVIANGQLIIYRPIWEEFPIQTELPENLESSLAEFEDGIQLAGYTAELIAPNQLQVDLWWVAHSTPTEDYHIFVHIIDGEGNILDQHDSRPQEEYAGYAPGWYFSMQWWQDGDIIRDPHVIVLEDPSILEQEGIELQVGVYRYNDFSRLQRVDTGANYPDLVRLPLELELEGLFG